MTASGRRYLVAFANAAMKSEMWKILIRFRVDARANAQPQVNAQCRKRLVSTTHPIVHDGSEPDRTRGM